MKLKFMPCCEGCTQIDAAGIVYTVEHVKSRDDLTPISTDCSTVLTCRNLSRCERLVGTAPIFRKPLYFCDVEKAKGCTRKDCLAKNKIMGYCWLTTNPDWAKLDLEGNKIIPTPCKTWDVYNRG